MPCSTNFTIINKVITDKIGNVLFDNFPQSSPIIKKFLDNQSSLKINQPYFLINVFEENYKFLKILDSLDEFQVFKYYFENLNSANFYPSLNQNFINNYHLNKETIFNFELEKREIIFGLLSGYLTDKELYHFLNSYRCIKETRIKYIIKILSKKFLANSRSDLVRSLRQYHFDKYFPESIYPAGIYDNSFRLINRIIK